MFLLGFCTFISFWGDHSAVVSLKNSWNILILKTFASVKFNVGEYFFVTSLPAIHPRFQPKTFFPIAFCVFHTLHFQCNSLNILSCKQLSGAQFPHIPLGSTNYTENFAENLTRRFSSNVPAVHAWYTKKKESLILKNRRQKCNLYASSVVNIFLQLFELLRHAQGISTHWVMIFFRELWSLNNSRHFAIEKIGKVEFSMEIETMEFVLKIQYENSILARGFFLNNE